MQAVLVFSEHRFLRRSCFRIFPAGAREPRSSRLGPLVDLRVTRIIRSSTQSAAMGSRVRWTAGRRSSDERTWFLCVRFEAAVSCPGALLRRLLRPARAAVRSVACQRSGRACCSRGAALSTTSPSTAPSPTSTGERHTPDSRRRSAHRGTAVRIRAAMFSPSAASSVKADRKKAQRLSWTPRSPRCAVGRTLACRFLHRFQPDDLDRRRPRLWLSCTAPPLFPLRLRVLDEETLQPLAGLLDRTRGRPAAKRSTPTPRVSFESPKALIGSPSCSLSRDRNRCAVSRAAPRRRVVTCECPVAARGGRGEAALEIRRQQWLRRIVEARHCRRYRTEKSARLVQNRRRRKLANTPKNDRVRRARDRRPRTERERLAQRRTDKAAVCKACSRRESPSRRARKVPGRLSRSRIRIVEAIARRDETTAQQNRRPSLPNRRRCRRPRDSTTPPWPIREGSPGFPNRAPSAKRSTGAPDAHEAWAIKRRPMPWPENSSSRNGRARARAPAARADGAEQALEICRKAEDRLTPGRFVAATLQHLTKIEALVEKYRGIRSPEDRERAQEWSELAAALRRLCATRKTRRRRPRSKARAVQWPKLPIAANVIRFLHPDSSHFVSCMLDSFHGSPIRFMKRSVAA